MISPEQHENAATPRVDVVAESPLWTGDAETIVRRAIAETAAAMPAPLATAELAVLLTDDAAVRALNHAWRGLDKPTNVLSFPAVEPYANDAEPSFGDIAIAFETTAREAEAEGKPFKHHLAHLTVHGFLHLLGYDHESDRQAEAMEDLERAILARLDVPDPYAIPRA